MSWGLRMSDDLGVYGDVLNDILFEALNKDVSKLIWLGEGRWLLTDCEEPGLYVIEMYQAEAVRALTKPKGSHESRRPEGP